MHCQHKFLGPRDSVLFIVVSVFQGVRISGFHALYMDAYRLHHTVRKSEGGHARV